MKSELKLLSVVSPGLKRFEKKDALNHIKVKMLKLFLSTGFLTIGISSVKRSKGSYLVPTLQSLFSQSSPEERSSMVVVVLLADFDVSWRVSTVREINLAFASELEQGQLVVIHVSQDWYPPLKGTVHVIILGGWMCINTFITLMFQ